ncbi:hypothetical protein ACKCRG_003967 [Serratia marcescens]
MKEELYELANHIASAKGGLPQEWQDWAEEIEADIRKLANREAQPVGKAEITKIAAELVRGDYLSKLWTEAEKSRHVNTHRLQILLDELHDVMKVKAIAITQLLTAPPAPVVVKLPAEFYSGEGIVVRLEEVMAALAVVGVQFERKANVKTRCEFPAPAVPKEMTIEQSYENVQTWHYANGWNACRAAMLDQPVSSGYTFNSPEIPDGWKLVPVEPTAEMINAALASGALSIRTAYREMLAAAPGES